MRSERPRNRAGKSLIEMLVVIATMSAILTLATQLLSRLSQSERTVRDETVAGQTQIQFARRFRSDARTANSATLLNGDGKSIKFSKPGETIVYESTADRLICTRKSQASTHRDALTLGEVYVTFRMDGDEWAIATSINRNHGRRSNSHASVEFQVVAKVGADLQMMSHAEVSPSNPISDQQKATTAPPVEAPKPARENL